MRERRLAFTQKRVETLLKTENKHVVPMLKFAIQVWSRAAERSKGDSRESGKLRYEFCVQCAAKFVQEWSDIDPDWKQVWIIKEDG